MVYIGFEFYFNCIGKLLEDFSDIIWFVFKNNILIIVWIVGYRGKSRSRCYFKNLGKKC